MAFSLKQTRIKLSCITATDINESRASLWSRGKIMWFPNLFLKMKSLSVIKFQWNTLKFITCQNGKMFAVHEYFWQTSNREPFHKATIHHVKAARWLTAEFLQGKIKSSPRRQLTRRQSDRIMEWQQNGLSIWKLGWTWQLHH